MALSEKKTKQIYYDSTEVSERTKSGCLPGIERVGNFGGEGEGVIVKNVIEGLGQTFESI